MRCSVIYKEVYLPDGAGPIGRIDRYTRPHGDIYTAIAYDWDYHEDRRIGLAAYAPSELMLLPESAETYITRYYYNRLVSHRVTELADAAELFQQYLASWPASPYNQVDLEQVSQLRKMLKAAVNWLFDSR